MTTEEKYEKCLIALQSLYHMLKTALPNNIHQEYINEILEEVGEDREQ